MTDTPQGMLTRDELAALVAQGEIDTVVVAFPDMHGRLMGKRYDADYFLDAAGHGMHFCNYMLANDIEMDTVPGYQYTSWEKGYGDATGQVDWATLRRASWLEGTAIVLTDIIDERDGKLVNIAPRSVLRAQLAKARANGYSAMGAAEIEFFLFDETLESAHGKGYEGLKTFGTYIEDYHIFQGTKVEPILHAMRKNLKLSGIPVEFSKGEWGPGQEEINIRYCEALDAADRAVLFKHLTREVAYQQGRAITFMAKWDQRFAGNSQHVHLSLWDTDSGSSLFAGTGEPTLDMPAASSRIFDWCLGGMIAHAREMSLFYAPTVNSYKRYQAGSFAPTGLAWSYDNRTAGFRIVGSGKSLRIECRIPGADANPYLVFAALMASGLDGIQNQIEPPPAFEGDVYAAQDLEHMPRSLYEAISVFEQSSFAREAFGEDVYNHYLHFARTEQQKFNEAVTNWERQRFFEQA